ncbi:hypothetical protein GCM10018787_00070 [Streptomyces thermodiastaticus]|jgi:hypothetical protein|nr:hypothetical protein GCM10018787_00070 [Streptomyces thermodiastaticus]
MPRVLPVVTRDATQEHDAQAAPPEAAACVVARRSGRPPPVRGTAAGSALLSRGTPAGPAQAAVTAVRACGGPARRARDDTVVGEPAPGGPEER